MTDRLFGFTHCIVDGALHVFLVHISPLRIFDATFAEHGRSGIFASSG
jgi:hypothetical protein